MEDLRVRLIEQLCRLPHAHLIEVESLLTRLKSPPASATHSQSGAARTLSTASSDWPHAPLHRLSEHGTFIVTAATHNKEHLFRGEDKLTFLEGELLRLAKSHDLTLEAWAVFSNHYHFVAHTAGVENQLAKFVCALHSVTAVEINRRDKAPGRDVWFNYWDTRLTFEKSYFARLNYVHHNAVKHGLVTRAHEYRWCSAAWFEAMATSAQVKTIYSFKYDRLRIDDDYNPLI